jgi:hypothetical protein
MLNKIQNIYFIFFPLIVTSLILLFDFFLKYEIAIFWAIVWVVISIAIGFFYFLYVITKKRIFAFVYFQFAIAYNCYLAMAGLLNTLICWLDWYILISFVVQFIVFILFIIRFSKLHYDKKTKNVVKNEKQHI